ncbi:MAG TPA: AbrB/MazE/SpoVT family DNA-binding domain-containing protein [Terriglobales bacterium]|nr:AbrB/MazE/SpoVT family DNA-binding domain-containing protein [Terriglobales bacterium]
MANLEGKSFAARVDAAGRLLIPAPLRRRSGLVPGSAVILTGGTDGEIVVRSQRAAVREAQAYFARLRRKGQRWSEELIADRRREVRREYGR